MVWRSIKEQDPEQSRYYLVTIDKAGERIVEYAYYFSRWYFANRESKKWEANQIKSDQITHLSFITLNRAVRKICMQCKNSPEVNAFLSEKSFGTYCIECNEVIDEHEFVDVPPAT